MVQLESYTLRAMIDQTIARFPNHAALSMVDEKPITYEQMGNMIQDVIEMLKDHGIQKGDKVVILSQNLPNWGVAYLAITYMGAIVVPILVDFHLNEIHQIIRHSGAKAIFVSNAHYDKVGYSDLDPQPLMFLLDNLTPIEANLSKDKLSEYINERKAAWKKFRNKALASGGLVDDQPLEDDLAAIIYT